MGEAASAAKGAVGVAAESGWQPASAAGCVHACITVCPLCPLASGPAWRQTLPLPSCLSDLYLPCPSALPCPALPCHALPCAAALPGLQGAVPATEFGNVKERGEAPATSGHAKEGWTRWK